jgi:hypothetical protein
LEHTGLLTTAVPGVLVNVTVLSAAAAAAAADNNDDDDDYDGDGDDDEDEDGLRSQTVSFTPACHHCTLQILLQATMHIKYCSSSCDMCL